MQGSANLNIMIKTARKAGRTLVKDFREVENLQASSQGAEDFVSKAKIATDAVVREALIEARGTYGYLSAGMEEIEGEDPTRRWIVDAMSGHVNYAHGLPHFAVTLALEHKGQIVSAVVFDAAKDEMFYAEKGSGAWLNDNKRVRVSARTKMTQAVFAHGVPHGAQRTLPATLKDMARLMPECAGLRASGAVSLDLVYVAAGRLDGMWSRETPIWDLAAGMLIASEAGALVEGLRVGQKPLSDGTILCANNQIFTALAKTLRSHD